MIQAKNGESSVHSVLSITICSLRLINQHAIQASASALESRKSSICSVFEKRKGENKACSIPDRPELEIDDKLSTTNTIDTSDTIGTSDRMDTSDTIDTSDTESQSGVWYWNESANESDSDSEEENDKEEEEKDIEEPDKEIE